MIKYIPIISITVLNNITTVSDFIDRLTLTPICAPITLEIMRMIE